MNKSASAGYRAGLAALLLSFLASGCGGAGQKAILGIDVTALPAPTVTAVAPLNNAAGVPTNTVLIVANFSEPMAATVDGAAFTLTCAAPCENPTGTAALDVTGTIATLTLAPAAGLSPLTLYTGTISGVKSLATGRPLASPYVWTFTTAAAPDATRPNVTTTVPMTAIPGPTAGLPTNTAIVAAFTEDMAPATINAGSFTVTCDAPCVSPAATVSYVVGSRSAVFTPAAVLAANTTYTATVTAAATDLAGNALAGNQAALPAASNYVWTFTTAAAPDTTRPAVTTTIPATAIPGPAAGLPTNTAIVAAFSEDMAPATITAASFTVACAAPCVSPAGTVSYVVGGRTAVFTPAAVLAAGTTYTATITTAATDLAGNALAGNQAPPPAAGNYVWTFTTAAAPDTTRPAVTTTIPTTVIPGPIPGLPTNTAIVAAFTEDMAPATLTAASFTVTCAAPCVSPAGTVSYVAGSRSAVFTPAAVLAASTTYTATITTAATDLAGNALTGNQAAPPAAGNYVWTFTTAAVPDTTRPEVTTTVPVTTTPGPTVGLPTNTAIVAAFTEDMAPATISGTSFTVTCVAPCVSPAGTVSYVAGSRSAVFTPAAVLAANTTYTAAITAAVTDLADNALAGNQAALPAASNYVWTFTTAAAPDTTRPEVTATVPVTTTPGPTVGLPTNTAIVAAFTEDMAPATITGTSFTVTCAAPCASPVGTVSYTVGSRTAVFTPAAVLTAGTTYTATITAAATDLAGNGLAGNQAALPAASNYSWTFTTAVAIPPANVSVLSTNPAAGATAVCPSATVNATFTVPSGLRMAPLSVNSATFTLKGPAPAVAAVAAASVVLDAPTGLVATFTPQSPLTSGGTYTASITGGPGGVKDLAVPANEMVSDATWSFTVGPATNNCLAPVSLASASTFGIFGGNAGMTNSGNLTVINGDIGTIATGTSTITGFHDTAADIYTESPGANVGAVNGTIYTCAKSTAGPTSGGPNAVSCNIATQARLDAQAAYLALAALPPGADPGANLGGLTLPPGVYTASAGSFVINGANLILDAQGNPNAVWVFQMTATLDVGGPGAAAPQSVILANSAQAKNVFWQVGTTATINAAGGGIMVGTIISQIGAVFSTAANTSIVTLDGRVLSLGASVTVVDTIVNVPAP